MKGSRPTPLGRVVPEHWTPGPIVSAALRIGCALTLLLTSSPASCSCTHAIDAITDPRLRASAAGLRMVGTDASLLGAVPLGTPASEFSEIELVCVRV